MLTLVALMCCVLGLTLNSIKYNGNSSAAATTISFGNGGFTADFEDELKALYGQLGGASVLSYADLKNAVDAKDGKKITSAELTAQNGEETKLTIGGKEWHVVYVSESGSGDVIVTLFLAASSGNSMFANNWSANNVNYKYPGDMYGTSLVRSYLVGSAYAAGPNVSALTSGTADAEWQNFAQTYGAYLAVPAQMDWQRNQGSSFEKPGNAVPNESAAPLNGYDYLYETRNYEDRDGYFDWAGDKIWLPSLTELGTSARAGIWNLSSNQLKDSANYLTRSGDSGAANYTYSITADGSARVYANTDTLSGVRPAINLNLRAVALDVESLPFRPMVVAAAQGATELNDGLTYSGAMQTAVRFSDKSNFLSASWEVDGTTQTVTPEAVETADWIELDAVKGLFSVKNAGTYTFWFSLKDEYASWEGAEDNAPQSVTFTVKPKALNVIWNRDDAEGDEDEGWYWNYNGLPHSFTATLDSNQQGVDWNDLGVGNDVVNVRYREQSGTQTVSAAPQNAGVYTVSASLNGQNPNYYIAESEWEEFTIKKLSITVKWVGDDVKNDAADGLHWIYDGKDHTFNAVLEGLISSDTAGAVTVDVSYAKGSGIENADETLVPKSAGEYTAFAVIGGTAKDNYNLVNKNGENIEYAEQVFKITPRTVTVNWVKNTVADDEYKNTYKWTYSGFDSRTDFSNTSGNTRYTFETEAESISGDTGVVGGLALNSTVSYATVTGGTTGAYDNDIRLNVGTYCVKVTISDSNYVLDNDVLQFSIEKRKVKIVWTGLGANGVEDGVIAWRYDGKQHVPTANATLTPGEVSGGADLGDYLTVTGAEKEVTAIKGLDRYEATVAFRTDITDGFNVDNYELENASVGFKIIKGLITDVTWYESSGDEIVGTPSYVWGLIKGKGPGYTAVAKTKVFNASGDEIEVSFNLTVSYPGASYDDGVEWAVNDVTGYKALGRLDGPSTEGFGELAQRFEFSTDGEFVDNTYITFLITRKAGEKDPVNIKWVVFVDNTTYYTQQQIADMGGAEIKINGGGYVFVEDGKFTFYYNGKPQTPSAIYAYTSPDENGNTYENLAVSQSGVKTDAGEWTSFLAPSAEFAYDSDKFECDYVIKPLNVKLSWTNTQVMYSGKLRTPTAVLDSEYVAAQPQWYKDLVSSMQNADGELGAITATGATDAGSYTSKAQLGDNFAAVDGTGSVTFKINPFAVVASAVKWDFGDALNDTKDPITGEAADPNAWYWIYDGKEHAPVPSLEAYLDGATAINLKLSVVGATSSVGEHYASAWLDPNDDTNKNFILVVSSANPTPTLARMKFTIAKLEIDNIIWKGEPVDENWTGAYISVDGTDYKAVDLGTPEAPDMVLAFIYTGGDLCAKPFYKDVSGKEVALNYEGAMQNVGYGAYSVRITDDFTFKDAAGNAIPTVARYVILPKPLDVIWLDNQGAAVDASTTQDKLVWEYNGKVQNPEVQTLVGVDGNDLVAGVDYSVSGWTDAGKYSAKLTFINQNYRVNNSDSLTYSVKPKEIDVEWTWDGITTDDDGNIVSPVFSYNAQQPDIKLSSFNWTNGAEATPSAPDADGKFQINLADLGDLVFEITYENLVDYVGSHKVKAVITNVWLKDAEGNLTANKTDNYTIILNGDEAKGATQEYEITEYVIYVDWTGTTDGEGNEIFAWTYDGVTEFAPTAKYTLWDGSEHAATVSGGRILAGDYVASITLPENLRTNCVFAKLDESGALDWENGVSCGEREYSVLKAEVEIEWKWTGFADASKPDANNDSINPDTGEVVDPNGWYWVYDGTAHAPEAYNKATGEQLDVTGEVTEAGENYVASASLKDAANYKFLNDNNQITFKITVRTVWINWVDESDKPDGSDFTWYYDGDEHAPKAVLANEDGTDFLIDGKTVEAIVSGSARNSGSYTATAAIASSNYSFPDGVKFTQTFKIVKLVLGEDDFWWEPENLDGVVFDGEKDGWYNYTFNGDVQYPVAVAKGYILFAYTFEAVDKDTQTVIGDELAGISDAGYYKVTVTIVSTSDYAIPAGMETVYVNIAPKTVNVEWDESGLMYNAENQSPKAYYTDVAGVKYELTVTVDETDHSKADVEYHAKANFIDAASVKNYVLGENTEKTYKIAKRSIRIEWGDSEFTYDAEEHFVSHTVFLNDALPQDITLITVSYVIKDSKGNVIKVDGNDAQAVMAAGDYVMVMQLNGDKELLKNYTLSDTDDNDAEQAFTIKRKKLVVTADSFVDDNALSYGDNAPTYTATFGEKGTGETAGEIFNGLVDGEDLTKYEGITVLADGKITGPWLDSAYVPFSEPGTYEISVDEALLRSILTNYDIVTKVGSLEVIAAPGTIIWYGDRLVGHPNFEYNGKEQKPDAYLYGSPDKLKVVYVDENGEELTDFKAIDAGKYNVKAVVPSNVTVSGKQQIEYEIFPREIVINIDRFEITYGDRELTAGDGSDLFTQAEIKKLWSYDGDKIPVNGDDLGIYFTWNITDKIVNGYLQAGFYYIEGHYNNDPNYKVTFEGINNEEAAPDMAQYGVYVVKLADITDSSKRGTEWYFEERIIDKYEQYFISIEEKAKDEDGNELDSYRYISYKGDQTAPVSFSYSKPYLVGRDEIPEPDDVEGNEHYPIKDNNNTGIAEIAGEWIINYCIEVSNHNTYYGRWRVLLKFEDEYIVVIFLKPYEIEYGTDVPENLTEVLVDEGYVQITIKDENVLQGLTAEEFFKAHATAYVPLGQNKFVTNRTKVGNYNINFELDVEEDPNTGVKLDVIYKRSNADEDSNLDMYQIIPRRLQILWGETEFTYDGNRHAPMPSISHWIGEGSFILDNIANGKEYLVTDGGITVKVTVYTEGNFVSSGGHKVTITVDDPNYTIATVDAVQTISIKGAFPWWLVYTVGALALAAMIAFVIMAVIMRKRKMIILAGISDDEGFYDRFVDDYDPSGLNDPYYGPLYNENDPTGLSDSYYAKDYNDGFDYEQMWADINTNTPPDNMN